MNAIIFVTLLTFFSPSHVTIAAANEPGQRIVITGRVLDASGHPVPHVGIRAYHTDSRGLYRADNKMYSSSEPPRLQGFLRTDANGTYEIDTIRPAPYPNRTIPAHIHFELRPPNGPRESAILYFADDPLLTADKRARQPEAICHLAPANGVLRCTRDFHLGKEGDE